MLCLLCTVIMSPLLPFYRDFNPIEFKWTSVYNVAYLLKARTEEAEKESLLSNALKQEYRRCYDT
jgi:hypothetical protein